jgi:aminoglycoside phosphotransferase (APT) family kinase protein
MDGWESVAASAVPLASGYGGETYAVSAAGEDAVLRLYLRHPARASVDVALLQLVRGLLPVPLVLDAKPEGEDGDPPYVLTERLPGVNLEAYLPTATEEQRRRVGEQLGELLARLSGMPFLRPGSFSGPDLAVEPFEAGELTDWFQAHAEAIGLDPELAGRFIHVIVGSEELADGPDHTPNYEPERVCLVHSDFNPKNLLVDPDTAAITGLVDWEFAHAGSPYTDLGNLLRFCTDPVLGGTVMDVVRRTVPGLGERIQERARAADLWALIDLAARAGQSPVATAARDLLQRIAETGDLAGGRIDLDVVH